MNSKRSKRKRDYARQVYAGEWYPLLGWDYETCCHCHLVHRIKYRLHKGRLEFQATEDPKRTRALRAKNRILLLKG